MTQHYVYSMNCVCTSRRKEAKKKSSPFSCSYQEDFLDCIENYSNNNDISSKWRLNETNGEHICTYFCWHYVKWWIISRQHTHFTRGYTFFCQCLLMLCVRRAIYAVHKGAKKGIWRRRFEGTSISLSSSCEIGFFFHHPPWTAESTCCDDAYLPVCMHVMPVFSEFLA